MPFAARWAFPRPISEKTDAFNPRNGRLQRYCRLGGRDVLLNLAKNPTGFNQNLKIVEADRGSKMVAFFINDQVADGRDISWIWDIDLVVLADQPGYGGVCRRLARPRFGRAPEVTPASRRRSSRTSKTLARLGAQYCRRAAAGRRCRLCYCELHGTASGARRPERHGSRRTRREAAEPAASDLASPSHAGER